MNEKHVNTGGFGYGIMTIVFIGVECFTDAVGRSMSSLWCYRRKGHSLCSLTRFLAFDNSSEPEHVPTEPLGFPGCLSVASVWMRMVIWCSEPPPGMAFPAEPTLFDIWYKLSWKPATASIRLPWKLNSFNGSSRCLLPWKLHL